MPHAVRFPLFFTVCGNSSEYNHRKSNHYPCRTENAQTILCPRQSDSIIFVLPGLGRAAVCIRASSPYMSIHPGDVVNIPVNVKHWHCCMASFRMRSFTAIFSGQQAVQAPHSMQSSGPAGSGRDFIEAQLCFSCRPYARMTEGMSMPAGHAALHLPQFVQACFALAAELIGFKTLFIFRNSSFRPVQHFQPFGKDSADAGEETHHGGVVRHKPQPRLPKIEENKLVLQKQIGRHVTVYKCIYSINRHGNVSHP